MGRRPSPYGRTVARYNRLAHGAMIDDVLPSIGPDRCPHRATCPIAKEEELHPYCRPGQPCTWESHILDKYVRSAKRTYTECLNWLTETERDLIICRLGILALRRIRLSALIANEGLLRDKVHPVSGLHYGKESALGIGRYATAIHNETQPLITLLLVDPDSATGVVIVPTAAALGTIRRRSD